MSGLKNARTHLETFSGPVARLLSVLRVSMTILSHASVKKKTKRFTVSDFALLLVVFK